MKPKYKFIYDGLLSDDFDLENDIIDKMGCRELADIELIRVKDVSEADFWKISADADGICAYLSMSDTEYKLLNKCQVVADPGIGFDPFDLKAATENGVCICNSPVYCVEEVATHTAALMLATLREIAMFDRNTRQGRWDWDDRSKVHRLAGTTYGILSFGRIPRRMIEMIRGFGMNFLVWDPYLPDSVFEEYGVTRASSIEEVFAKSYITSIHTPASPGTYHMIGDKQFNAIPNSMILIVTSRGGVVDESALLRAIKNGKISHVGLDVIEDETTFKTVLQGLPNVTMTPHTAFYSEESNNQLRTEKIQQLLETVVLHKEPQYLVNKDVLGKARFEKH